LISADEITTAREELASSPSSSEISMAKENRLSGESYSWERKDKTGYFMIKHEQ